MRNRKETLGSSLVVSPVQVFQSTTLLGPVIRDGRQKFPLRYKVGSLH